MKLVRLISTSVGASILFLLFGTTALIYAQDQRDEAKTPRQETRPEASKPTQDEPSSRQGEAKPRNRARTSLSAAMPSRRQSSRIPSRPGSRDRPANQTNRRNVRQTIVGVASPMTSSAPNSADNIRSKSTARLRLRDSQVFNTEATRSSLLTHGQRNGSTLTIATSTTSTGSIFSSTCFIPASASRLLSCCDYRREWATESVAFLKRS